jgi:cytochrome c oxidase subunit II
MKALVAFTAIALTLLAATFAGAQRDASEGGAAAFMRNGCHGCHTLGRLGTPIGPDLSHVGGKYSHDFLDRWLRDPAAVTGTAHMPALQLSEADMASLCDYLSSLR